MKALDLEMYTSEGSFHLNFPPPKQGQDHTLASAAATLCAQSGQAAVGTEWLVWRQCAAELWRHQWAGARIEATADLWAGAAAEFGSWVRERASECWLSTCSLLDSLLQTAATIIQNWCHTQNN